MSTPLYAGLGSKHKTFSNYRATYEKELCLLFENRAIFLQSECTDSFDSPPLPVHFSSLFTDPSLPSARRTYFLNDPYLKIKLLMSREDSSVKETD